jgi:hypothetical protein
LAYDTNEEAATFSILTCLSQFLVASLNNFWHAGAGGGPDASARISWIIPVLVLILTFSIVLSVPDDIDDQFGVTVLSSSKYLLLMHKYHAFGH